MLAESLDRGADPHQWLSLETLNKAAALLRSLAEEPQAEPAKPYGYVITWSTGQKQFFNGLPAYDDPGATAQAVYTHPAAKQERLTDKQLQEVRDQFVFGEDRSVDDELELMNAVQSACAKAWGVKL